MANKKPSYYRAERVMWSDEENEILRRHMIRNPNNLTAAFEATAVEIPSRTVRAVAGHYYQSLKTDPKFRIMAVLTPDGKGSYNTKNVSRKQYTTVEDPDNELIQTIRYLATKLKPGQRKELVDMLFIK